ncbi:MAG: hypothetical protein A2600_05655 [Candidatus Lambdaproteobacteria bacterium RIFOXYD1_FULL_56_27]|uniref:DUF218 domain-containing protein n=1 Tax=Candidatus Lambdaproteobacteria bacterium RIFOXYD2_FULL_56_26 TaxID=1817773 RepID=A0A1F6GR89_9PROT|nr:MAG: hypothetical protein A2426_10860 [Candidatus Lambdaproteobacteria bacterium RIFOXYC1_FULL_56_13]OGH00686.1 MAG: hypothetical protein A2557_03360 [Candidatus Lambdaproteobacteria bacterium RIFOXYD2_FULL_56_26]OGH07853.1 MAG: hypothetical protein A2600_05655 [Candidatus Lambdaproteobacteria bacterium RIFOXYD1_FULL_56_27]
MFFWFSKILRFLLDPITWGLLLLGYAGWRSRSRLVWAGLALLFGLATPVVSKNLLYLLEHTRASSAKRSGYNFVIVLTGMLNLEESGETLEFNGAVDRILAGAAKVSAGEGDRLLIVGGDGSLVPTRRSEAQLLARWVPRLGVRPEQILVEPVSRNTAENAALALGLTGNRPGDKLLLVTSAFHGLRALGAFEAQGVKPDLLLTDYRGALAGGQFLDYLPSSNSLGESALVLTEVSGLLVYLLTGKAQL